MKPTLQQLAQLLRNPAARLAAVIVLAVAALTVAIWLLARSRRPSAEELERRRCERLAAIGRITDGVLLDAHIPGENPISSIPLDVLVYSYRIAGVTYNCAQDVSRLKERASGFFPNQSVVGQTVQVRYDPHNPGDSILISETWTGLWKRAD